MRHWRLQQLQQPALFVYRLLISTQLLRIGWSLQRPSSSSLSSSSSYSVPACFVAVHRTAPSPPTHFPFPPSVLHPRRHCLFKFHVTESCSRERHSSSSSMSSGGELSSDLIVSAQDTFEEVLGWYGLRPYTQFTDQCAEVSPMDTASTGSVITRDTTSATRDTASVVSRDSSDEDADVEVDGENPVDLTSVAPMLSSSAAEHGTISDVLKMQWGSHKKLVGIRFLFPPLDEQMSLLEKATIWVTRHDYKYFVDWTEAELESIDPILRPLSVITRDIYKLHMNRSEYCRNVKLKYCLQSDAPWAQQFRENLAKSATEGGFTGLCQAKIVAAELWRKYSEHYRSHQARHPNLRNRDAKVATTKGAMGNTKNEPCITLSGPCYDALCTDSDALSEDGEKEGDGKPSIGNDLGTVQRPTATEDADKGKDGVLREDEDVPDDNEEDICHTIEATNDRPKRHKLAADFEEPSCKKMKEEMSHKGLDSINPDHFEVNVASSRCHSSNDCSTVINLTKKILDESEKRQNNCSARISSPSEASVKSEVTRDADTKSNLRHATPTSAVPYWNVSQMGPLMYQLPMAAYYTNPMSCFLDSSLNSSGLHHPIYPFGSASQNFASPASGLDSMAPLKKPSKVRSSSRNEINTEYRRSERGLSFLFPSFSDHNMSLMEKVQITITRHKNNYFLGWDEATLEKLDPLVRPKMVVTSEIYKEYCHRNAMKYDSNLQFAMESTEPWAQDFRKKLSLPASEGGFTSLCEVKLEAGRLWREYSGKYRMHNIVKWQMDLNSNTVPAKSPGVGLASETRCNKFGFRKIQRRTRVKDQRVSLQRSLHSLQNGGLMSMQNGSSPSPHSGGHSYTQTTHAFEHLRKASGRSSPLARSFSEGASPRVFSQGDAPPRDMCRVSRSLDNSPSMGGSCDGTASSASVVGDTGCSLTMMPSPKATVAPRHVESSNDFLFLPLPRQMPVAQQLFIWLERHSNNYFLGFPKETLSSLHSYLRPQMVVTREVFQRHIPESMVDVLGKIKWMMSSNEDWAVKFCERLAKNHKDGGFSTFEEALTEAVVLWHINKDRRAPERSLAVNNPKSMGVDLKAEVRRQSCKADDSHSKVAITNAQDASWSPASRQECERLPKELDASASSKSLMTKDDDESKDAICVKSVPLESGSGFAAAMCSPNLRQSQEVSLGSLLQLLWNLRQALHLLCQDNAAESWQQRLTPFLSVLQRVVGASYVAPSTSSSCIVDLVMAVMHRHLEEFFSDS